MTNTITSSSQAEPETVTRAYRYALDVTPSQDRLLRNYCGSVRFAYNWALARVKDNLATRAKELAEDVPEAERTEPVSWSFYSMSKRFNAVKDEVAPWWRQVSMHAFRTGIRQCAEALANFNDSRNGSRKGRKVGFPNFKSRRRSKLSVTFVELNHQLSWLHDDRHHVRLMLPRIKGLGQARRDELGWIHTHGSTRRLYRLVEQERATIAEVTISRSGGRWWVSLVANIERARAPKSTPRKVEGDVVGVDVGIQHLATLSKPVDGLTDEDGHVPNPRVLEQHLDKLAELNRQLARKQDGSNNRRRLLRRRARLYGKIAETRRLHLHRLSRELAARFETVVVEDLELKGLHKRSGRRRLGRALSDVALGRLKQMIGYKTKEYGHRMVEADRWFPSSKRCSGCGAVRAKLPLSRRRFDCNQCGLRPGRDVNAARNLAWWGRQILAGREPEDVLAGLRPESRPDQGQRNGDPRSCKTTVASGRAGRGSLEDTTPQPSSSAGGAVSDGDGTLVTASGRQHR